MLVPVLTPPPVPVAVMKVAVGVGMAPTVPVGRKPDGELL